jgi:hypothetical protein
VIIPKTVLKGSRPQEFIEEIANLYLTGKNKLSTVDNNLKSRLEHKKITIFDFVKLIPVL